MNTQSCRSWTPEFNQISRRTQEVGPRQRLEWDTRDTINNRMWADTMNAGAKAVHASMINDHVTRGAYVMQPSNSRKDSRPYHGGRTYFPDATSPTERPRLPPKALFQNAWMEGYDIDSGDVVRELRCAVEEDNRYAHENADSRIAGRTFEHQWIPASETLKIVDRKIEASELLRPAQDDYRLSYRPE